MDCVEELPSNFEQDVLILEEGLRMCTLTFRSFSELLNLYKQAISYYVNIQKSDTKKNEFISKYKYALNDPYILQLVKRSASRYTTGSLVATRRGKSRTRR